MEVLFRFRCGHRADGRTVQPAASCHLSPPRCRAWAVQRDGANGGEGTPPASPASREETAETTFRFMDLGMQEGVFLARTSLFLHLSNSVGQIPFC